MPMAQGPAISRSSCRGASWAATLPVLGPVEASPPVRAKWAPWRLPARSRRVSDRPDGKVAPMIASQEPVADALRRLTQRPASEESTGGATKQELYERAKELDIPRRSAMTKD